MKKLRMLTVILSFVFALRSVSYANAVDIENPSPNKDETVAVTFHCGKGEFVDIDEKTFVKDVKVCAEAIDISDDGGLIVRFLEGPDKDMTRTLHTGEVSVRFNGKR